MLQPNELKALLKAIRKKAAILGASYRIPRTDMEDILQDALFTYVAKAHIVKDPEAWLTTTLRNRCVIYIREAKTEKKYMDAYAYAR